MLAHASYNDSLVARLAAGDETAFQELFHLHWNNIYSVAFTFIKSQVVAEEIVQDVFLKIWLKREQLPTIEHFDNYLFIIARNQIYNELRKKGSNAPTTEREDGPSPEQQLLLKETAQIVHRAVKQLPLQQRTVFELSRNEGLDYASIATRLGVSRLTVKSHMNKALHFIRAYLSRHTLFLEILAPLLAALLC